MLEKENQLLLERIAQLENELEQLKKRQFPFASKQSKVNVPSDFQSIFDQAEAVVGDYFDSINANPSEGSIEIHGERYVLMRASSLSVDFFNKIKNLYADKGEKEALNIGSKFLFDIAHVLGNADAKNFHQKMNLLDPISKLSAGPVHFAYSGWAKVEILPESSPTPDDNFYLKYYHPYSFEAESWLSKSLKADRPVCIMNAGYSSGWCEESFGIPLTAVEISCRAKGDSNCTFIMAPPHRIKEHISKEESTDLNEMNYEIPLFFERKKAEDKIIQSLKEKDILLKEVHHRVKNNLQIISSFLNLQSLYLPDSLSKEVFSKTKNRVKSIALVHEKLYQSEDLQRVDIENYIISIINLLKESFNATIEISTNIKCQTTNYFTIDRAIPCGLIINELVSNAIKHGKSESGIDKVCVSFTDNNNQFIISVKDNGVGLPENYDFYKSKTIGFEIILA
ncbi:MAG: hypothetical protein HYR91_02900, partial [Flavobacteriia bacterium]|nr:hypothetical protein [Flavobacteriia bacterium]